MYSEQPRMKMQRHMIKIRRQARHKILQQMRNRLHFETLPIAKIAQQFGLPPKDIGEYCILEILEKCYQQIMNIGNKIGGMNEQKQQNSTQMVTLDTHVNFWAYLLQQLYNDKIKLTNDIQIFFIRFIEQNKYSIIAKEQMLQLKVLNTLEVAMVPGTASVQFKQCCLHWVAGTEALTLIYNSLPSSFLSLDEFPNVYKILVQCLQLCCFQKLQQVCETIKIIMKSADFDDTFRIYQQHSDLMAYLVPAIQKWVDTKDVDKCADAVVYLMDTYNQAIYQYAKSGVGLLAILMITSKRQNNVVRGMQIIKFISQVQQTATMLYLLQDRQLQQCGLWSSTLSQPPIPSSSYSSQSHNFNNITFRRELYATMSNIMSNGDYTCCYLLNSKVKQYQHRELVQLVAILLKNQEDVTIILSVLNMFSYLAYYSQNFTTGEHDQEFGDINQYGGKRMHRQNFMKQFAVTIVQLGIQKQIKRLSMHENQKIAESATTLCASVQYILGTD